MASTARRRQLGTWLRKLRTEAELTPEDAAQHLGCSPSKIRHWEAGRSGAKKVELESLLKFYGADSNVREQLEETRRDGAKRGWWTSYRLPNWFEPFVGFETDASEVRNFELDLVPGLLQTEEYARELHRVGRFTTDPEALERWVAVRMERQRRLRGEDAVELRAVVAEEALHRIVGDQQVMQAQLQHLLEASELPNVILQILPFDAGAQPCPAGPFVVLSFPGADNEDIGYTDTPLGGHIVEEATDVAALRNLFDDVRSLALPVPASQDLLRTMTSKYET